MTPPPTSAQLRHQRPLAGAGLTSTGEGWHVGGPGRCAPAWVRPPATDSLFKIALMFRSGQSEQATAAPPTGLPGRPSHRPGEQSTCPQGADARAPSLDQAAGRAGLRREAGRDRSRAGRQGPGRAAPRAAGLSLTPSHETNGLRCSLVLWAAAPPGRGVVSPLTRGVRGS